MLGREARVPPNLVTDDVNQEEVLPEAFADNLRKDLQMAHAEVLRKRRIQARTADQ